MTGFFKNYTNFEWVSAKKSRLVLSLIWQFVYSMLFTTLACGLAIVLGKFILMFTN